ncbi:MAG: response regulator [Myxococcales bacterium]|nr:response regulator [Myxococcales bacterium]
MSQEILVVDDSRDARALVVRALTPAGYRLTEAQDGLDGLDRLDEMESVAALLIDVNMPVISGLEMQREVRRNPKFQEVPVVMLTNEANPDLSFAKAKRAGATAWLQKTVSAI